VTRPDVRRHRAGGRISDLCRACKTTRDHTVIAVDGDGRAVRVVCDFCGSQHNYRGLGDEPPGREDTSRAPAGRPRLSPPPAGAGPTEPKQPAAGHDREPPSKTTPHTAPAVERTTPLTREPDPDLETLLRRVVREELGLTPGAPAPRWRGGEVVLRPGRPELQEKSWPVDALFHKIVMIRNRLRTLEQQLNAAEIPEDLKVRLQSYVTGCYGSLTSFNVLFADEADQFKGAGGGD
jgi:hypothetical protein